MSKVCARCEKTVFVTEELKCLDKVYHRGCFKCRECSMTLNMRTYKGFNKEPYCEAHIPKAKATTMAETPELRRIAENTKIQSNVKYHADFEKSKGKFTQVADDPETLRIKQNSKIISNVAYHGELQKKAAMEQKRTINENGEYIDVNEEPNANIQHQPKQQQHQPQHHQQQHQPQQHQPQQHQSQQHQPQQHQLQHQPQQHQPQQHQSQQHQPQQHQPQQQQQHQQQQHHSNPPINNAIGKISDYDPLAGSSPYSARTTSSQTVIYTSDRGAINNPPPGRTVGSIADIDPVNHNYGSLGRVYRAMYDYDSQDTDEVSFLEGDLIINVSSIDGGWMTGEVQRTGDSGMLPANYVQLANI